MRAVIYWYFKDRSILELNEFEKLHFKYIKEYDFRSIFHNIDFVVSYDRRSDDVQGFVHKVIKENIVSNYSITDIDNVQWQGEYPAYYGKIFKYIETGFEPVFYCHFKGVRREDSWFVESRKKWIDVLYRGCFADGTLHAVRTYPMAGAHLELKDVDWYRKWLWKGQYARYAMKYPYIARLTGGSYLDGTFQWINPVLVREYFKSEGVDINYVMNIEFEDIRFTHFSEYFLCSIIRDDKIYANIRDLRHQLGY